MKRIRRVFTRKPAPFEWPSELARYADMGPHLAVALRIVSKYFHRRTVHLPFNLWVSAQDQLPPIARYMDVAYANAGYTNFMLKNVVVLPEGAHS